MLLLMTVMRSVLVEMDYLVRAVQKEVVIQHWLTPPLAISRLPEAASVYTPGPFGRSNSIFLFTGVQGDSIT